MSNFYLSRFNRYLYFYVHSRRRTREKGAPRGKYRHRH